MEKLKIKDIMTVNPIVVNQQVTVQGAVSLMLKHRIDGLPVVDNQETLVGIFTKTHALKALGLDTKIPVSEIMQRSVIIISDEASPEEAWQIPVGRLVVVNSAGQMVGIITRTDLVTAFQRKLEYALEEFIDIINSSHNSIIAVDRNGRIVLMNKAAEKMMGIAVSEVQGKDIDSIIANSGLSEVIQGSSCQLDLKVCIRDKVILANRTPIIKNGIIIGAVGVYQEISELENLASEFKNVKRINEELNTVIEYSADGFIVADADGNIIKANRASCDILGIPDSDIIGKHVNWMVEKGYNTESVIMKVLKTKKQVSLTKKLNNGKEVLSTGTPIFDENGNIYRVISNLRDLTELNRLSFELNKAKLELEQYRMENSSENIIYRSIEMRRNVEKAIKVAKFDSTVMLLGESGVGKEVLAKLIYSSSKRSKGPFVKINCATIPYNLFESELFGYEGGAFTGGSKEGRLGLLELANNGTAFLDEIGEMPLDLQVKLLRVLQEREILRVGGRKQIKLDIRIIAATNRDLEEMVKKGRFREDLYWRLNVVSIQILPLRKRREDITALIYHFMQNFNQKHNTNKTITASVIARMVEYNWPGNVREIENTIERMLVLSTGSTIDLDSLWFDSDQNKIEKWATLNYWEVMNETEKRLITQVYNDCKSTRKAAKILGIHQSTIVSKLKKFKQLSDE
ncbi:sigma 54-interacting transcriptional regulator [Desulfosporosinus sp. BICA1-9]|uniref:sigma 54-interacting transcriptional regulator n=1 Tax=Desulfosporosinus sp. BICA1-9 TaxID=1531958 RepID=UPI000A5433CB|nr:sigma 54-interacting transcriptional regulator [Desulfosporosinus sp. BICA1-9]HBW35853.1 AAA family ATPase [Desulfosporosinus sp.]